MNIDMKCLSIDVFAYMFNECECQYREKVFFKKIKHNKVIDLSWKKETLTWNAGREAHPNKRSTNTHIQKKQLQR